MGLQNCIVNVPELGEVEVDVVYGNDIDDARITFDVNTYFICKKVGCGIALWTQAKYLQIRALFQRHREMIVML